MSLPQIVTRTEDEPVVSRIAPRNREMILRFVEGQSIPDIARYYGLGEAQVRLIVRSPLAQQMIEKYVGQSVRDRLEGLTGEAVDTVRDIMRGKRRQLELEAGEIPVATEHVLKASSTILDRSSLGKRDEGSAAEGLGESIIRAISKRINEKAGVSDSGDNCPTDNLATIECNEKID